MNRKTKKINKNLGMVSETINDTRMCEVFGQRGTIIKGGDEFVFLRRQYYLGHSGDNLDQHPDES